MSRKVQTGVISTHIPARLDRLPWSRFHWRVVAGLGGVWIRAPADWIASARHFVRPEAAGLNRSPPGYSTGASALCARREAASEDLALPLSTADPVDEPADSERTGQ